MNYKFDTEKLEEKIDKLEQNINKLCNKENTFREADENCKNIFQKEKMETLSHLLKALCHEMNQPLQAITGYLDLIKLDPEVNCSIMKGIKQICDQMDKANIINRKIADVLKYLN